MNESEEKSSPDCKTKQKWTFVSKTFQSRSRSIALFSGGKKESIAEILGLNEKTISTYKLRLLTKLNVTNLVDLVNKAKKLEIV
jgi:DNA-binding NarL/FixJ family response regulator